MKCWQDIKKNVSLILTRLKRYTHKSNIIFIYPCECAQGWLCYRYYIIWCWLQILYIPDEEEREILWIEKYNESNDLHQVLRRERIELETYFSTKNRKRNSCYVKKTSRVFHLSVLLVLKSIFHLMIHFCAFLVDMHYFHLL